MRYFPEKPFSIDFVYSGIDKLAQESADLLFSEIIKNAEKTADGKKTFPGKETTTALADRMNAAVGIAYASGIAAVPYELELARYYRKGGEETNGKEPPGVFYCPGYSGEEEEGSGKLAAKTPEQILGKKIFDYIQKWSGWGKNEFDYLAKYTDAKSRAIALTAYKNANKQFSAILADNLKEGETVRDFLKRAEKKNIAAQLGLGNPLHFPRGSAERRHARWYINNVYRTNTALAYGAGRYDEAMQSAEVTILEYSAVRDKRTTELCASLDGSTFRKTDPKVADYYPPNHFQCRSEFLEVSRFEPNGTTPKLKRPIYGPPQDEFKRTVKRNKWLYPTVKQRRELAAGIARGATKPVRVPKKKFIPPTTKITKSVDKMFAEIDAAKTGSELNKAVKKAIPTLDKETNLFRRYKDLELGKQNAKALIELHNKYDFFILQAVEDADEVWGYAWVRHHPVHPRARTYYSLGIGGAGEETLQTVKRRNDMRKLADYIFHPAINNTHKYAQSQEIIHEIGHMVTVDIFEAPRMETLELINKTRDLRKKQAIMFRDAVSKALRKSGYVKQAEELEALKSADEIYFGFIGKYEKSDIKGLLFANKELYSNPEFISVYALEAPTELLAEAFLKREVGGKLSKEVKELLKQYDKAYSKHIKVMEKTKP